MDPQENDNFCPILKDKCRDDCAWKHAFVFMDDSGLDKEEYCAVNVITNMICKIYSNNLQ